MPSGLVSCTVGAGGHVTVRCSAADVEAAQFRFATGVEAVLRRRHVTTEALHIAELRAQSEYIVTGWRRLEIVHRPVALVSHEGREVAHIAPDTCCLQCRGELFAGARAQRVVDRVVGVGERNGACDDALKRVGTLNAGPEADGLEESLRGGAECSDRGFERANK